MSYERYPAGIDHSLYVIHKGFQNERDLDWATSFFRRIEHIPVHVEDDRFDIGAYLDAAPKVSEGTLCLLNTGSEILCRDWLVKLAVNFNQPNVALVGSTGSFESLNDYNSVFPGFPNAHLRSNAFMIDRNTFCSIAGAFHFKEKVDAFLFESGPLSMTRRIQEQGLEILVVGRNGRGYSPRWWPHSGTFRQGMQSNLLIGDNQTRNFDAMTWPEKREASNASWDPICRRRKRSRFWVGNWLGGMDVGCLGRGHPETKAASKDVVFQVSAPGRKRHARHTVAGHVVAREERVSG